MYKKVVLLDLDDTLCDSELAYKFALRECYKYFKTIYTKKVTEKSFGLYYKRAKERVHKELGNEASSHNRLLYFQQMFEDLDIQPRAIWLSKLERTYWQTTNKKLKLFTGVKNVLEEIRKRKIKICLVSDLLASVQIGKIKALKIGKYIDYIVTSEEVGVEKPDKRVFKEALNKCGVKAEETVMVGNSCKRDIAGAKASKIVSIHFGKEKCSIADYSIKKFDELLKIISVDEGYVKFNYKWTNKKILKQKDIGDVNKFRQKLYSKKLIGQINSKIGYGNVSQRLNVKKFIVTGTETGLLKKLNKKHYSVVTDYDFNKNKLNCTGETVASSESLSHAMIYQCSKDSMAVIHVHNSKMWNKYLNKIPTTRKQAAYGTIEMSMEIKRLFNENKFTKDNIFAMAGHEDGIIAFGYSLENAYNTLIKYFK